MCVSVGLHAHAPIQIHTCILTESSERIKISFGTIEVKRPLSIMIHISMSEQVKRMLRVPILLSTSNSKWLYHECYAEEWITQCRDVFTIGTQQGSLGVTSHKDA